MTTTAPAPVSSPEASPEDYEAYQTIVQLVSKTFTKSMNDSLEALKDAAQLRETVSEAMAANGTPEATPSDEEAQRLLQLFWKYARGLDAKISWRSTAGLPERSYMDVASIKPPTGSENGQEFSIGVSAFGFGVGVSW